MAEGEEVYLEPVDVLLDSKRSSKDVLSELRLQKAPSQIQVYADIEQRILSPSTTLPDHWLPQYQV